MSDSSPGHSTRDPLREQAGIGVRDERALLEVTGADRARFLHGYLTCDVKGLAAGRASYGFFTSREGRILADAWVAALGEALIVSLPAARGESIAAHLARYILADRVSLRLRDDLVALHLAGPEASPLLAAACGLAAPDRHGVETVARGAGEIASRIVLRRDLGRIPGFELWVEATAGASLRAELVAAGARPTAGESFDRVRIEEGVPRFGVDFDEQCFPQETGLDAVAVSYTKGCYLGQEVVARIHYRGGVQRGLKGLRFFSTVPPAGTVLLHDGREAGTAESVAVSPRFGAIGLAVLHRRVGEPPARLELAGGGIAELVVLPFDFPVAPRVG